MPGLADTFRASAEYADIAGHRLQGSSHTVVLFTIGISPRRPGGFQRRRLGFGIHIRQFFDVSGRYAADLLCPLR